MHITSIMSTTRVPVVFEKRPQPSPPRKPSGTSGSQIFVGGVVEGLLTYPIETIKVRRQNGIDISGNALFRGVPYYAVLRGIQRASMFGSYDFFKPYGLFVAAVPPSITEILILSPYERIKTMLQSGVSPHMTSWAFIKASVKQDGIRVLSTGLAPTLFRNYCFNLIFFGSMEYFEFASPVYRTFLCASLAITGSHFLDSMKTDLQSRKVPISGREFLSEIRIRAAREGVFNYAMELSTKGLGARLIFGAAGISIAKAWHDFAEMYRDSRH